MVVLNRRHFAQAGFAAAGLATIAGLSLAQADDPNKKLDVFLGKWQSEGTFYDSPFSKAGKVNSSIDSAIEFLKSQQIKVDGNWRINGHADGVGPTSLVMLALLGRLQVTGRLEEPGVREVVASGVARSHRPAAVASSGSGLP